MGLYVMGLYVEARTRTDMDTVVPGTGVAAGERWRPDGTRAGA